MHQSTDRITHTTAFVTPVVEHWLDHHEGLDHNIYTKCLCHKSIFFKCFLITKVITLLKKQKEQYTYNYPNKLFPNEI